MEHRHDREHRIRLRDRERVGKPGAKRMQHGRTMREQHTLRIARRRRRVAENRGLLLIDRRPVERLGTSGNQFFVRLRARKHVALAHHDERNLHIRVGRHRVCNGRRERRIDEHELIVGVREHPAHLLRKQTNVDRVQHRADHRNGIVQFEMPVRVPTEARDAVTRLDAQFDECVCELRDAFAEIRVRVTERRAAHDVFEDPRDREIHVHHRARHRGAHVETRVQHLHYGRLLG